MAIPPGLIERIRNGEAVLVAGLGFETAAEVTGWAAILRHLTGALPPDAESGGHDRAVLADLEVRGKRGAALAYVRQLLPERAVAGALREAFPDGAAVSELVRLASQLPWNGVVTSSFSDVWERALEEAQPGIYRAIEPSRLADGRGAEVADVSFLMHVLGRPTQGSLCLAAADLRRASAHATATFLRERFAQRPFVFLGFQPDDPDLRLLVERMLGATPTGAEHFLLYQTAPEPSPGAPDVLGAELDLTVVPYLGSLRDTLRGLGDAVLGKDGYARTPTPAPVDTAVVLGGTDPNEWIRAQRAAVDAAPVAERAALLERMGDVYREKLGSSVQAISCYRQALVQDGARRSLLEKLRALYEAHKHWRAAEEVLVRLAQIEPAQERRARLLFEAAVIQRDELESNVRAAQLLARSLEDDPSSLEVLGALEELLAQERNWPLLGKLYQKVLSLGARPGGVVPSAAVRRHAADRLADLAQQQLGDPRLALKALEVAEVADPGNSERQRRMGELYLQVGPGYEDKAIAFHQALLEKEPDRLASYRTLADLYRATGDRDRLWCVAATLVFLRKADDDLKEVYEAGRASTTPSGPLPEALWSVIAHPDEARDLQSLFGIVGACLWASRAEAHESAGFPREERRNGKPEHDHGSDASLAPPALLAFERAARTLVAGEHPDLFVGETGGATIVGRSLRDGDRMIPALIVMPALWERTDASDLAFVFGQALALLRPEKLLRTWPRSISDRALRAALHVAGARVPGEGEWAELERLAAELRAFLPRGGDGALVAAARTVATAAGEGLAAPAFLDRWRQGVELTAARAGFLAGNDLGAAARVLAAESQQAAVSVKARLKDLVAFSVSEAYFKARRALGFPRAS
jgi:tetratricopeptide (TPR) repeat protein